jgi:periplasmic copper chaperone A
MTSRDRQPGGERTMNSSSGPRHVVGRLTAILIIALLVAACGSSGSTSGGIRVLDPWARPSPAMAGAGAAYMVIENTGSTADFLTGGSSPVAKAVEVHETVVMDSAAPAASDGMGGMKSPAASGGMGSGSGMMGMQRIDGLEIPPGANVELKPGSYHIMLIDLTQELKAGEKIEITLNFQKAGAVKVMAEVRQG